ncbi:membrane protease YdiL (CAAX protease family) [Chromobacterium alkanivorans]|uniref:CPBP family intramembrane glutamic endopeptidase n=1 Tax=Chromobacterium alkanivorans TaxID=1071719 RepID=UPI0021676E09|nr:CPBP family intramembrane glutamic endopeptidase [Chromobacterium alkanivorans]MCS3805687.1 membrane protease YdiL (CAAX protease family) [Chromobacterium alkanivorans]MCS3820083.1 membrane protease YdiL (CAAX protease family) [Chromobacterium alkanivorans]MCS3874840.1 membrane protease YdiL (CAAX protease family) [Chromobacterium alkanivorans]
MSMPLLRSRERTGLFGLIAALAWAQLSSGAALWGPALLAALCVWRSWSHAQPLARMVMLLVSVCLLNRVLLPGWQIWPLIMLLPILATSLVFWRRDRPRLLEVMRMGRVRARHAALGVLVGLISSGVLLLWMRWFAPDLRVQAGLMPAWPATALLAVILGFALLNSWMEEVMYRGMVQGSLIEAGLSLPIVLTVQAMAFSAAHYAGGVPNGLVGVGLTLWYGLALGGLRAWSGGLAAAFIAHVTTDVCIGTVLAFPMVRMEIMP